jgi:hypothetical protein
MNDSQKEKRAPRDRSPSFPFISLKIAIARLVEFEQKFGRQESPADRAYLAWGMKGDTSQAQQTLAALKAFGLVDYKGSGPKRFIAISDDARTYLRAQQESVRKEVLKKLALKPRWIGHFWPLWDAARGPDEACLDALVLTHKFNQNAAPLFLSVYDETIAFAGLSDSDKLMDSSGSEAGSASETEDIDNGDSGKSPLSSAPPPLPPVQKQKAKLMESERELTTGLLSKDASFRLLVSGVVGVTEIERLIRKLELDKEILADQDDVVVVHKFRVWDGAKGEYVTQPLKSPADRIARIGGEIVPGTGVVVPRSALDVDGRYAAN